MHILPDCILLFFYCSFPYWSMKYSTLSFVIILINLLIILYTSFFNSRKITMIFLTAYILLVFMHPTACLFLPVLVYILYIYQLYFFALFYGIAILAYLDTFSQNHLLLMILGTILALYLGSLRRSFQILKENSIKARDDSRELTLLLNKQNKTLIEKQNYEIHNAKLMERNRIAREIHDNVGHMLSRAILMTGALQTINQEENAKEPLNLLQETLSEAMDNIRKSVHDLHDESINLEESIRKIANDFSFCPIQLVYEVTSDVPKELRYAMLSIIKEALTNVNRHSNATSVNLSVREHPSMYQLIIHDNGTTASKKREYSYHREGCQGIGLTNIHDRVVSLKGNLHISSEKGFRIFISFPKDTKALKDANK